MGFGDRVVADGTSSDGEIWRGGELASTSTRLRPVGGRRSSQFVPTDVAFCDQAVSGGHRTHNTATDHENTPRRPRSESAISRSTVTSLPTQGGSKRVLGSLRAEPELVLAHRQRRALSLRHVHDLRRAGPWIINHAFEAGAFS